MPIQVNLSTQEYAHILDEMGNTGLTRDALRALADWCEEIDTTYDFDTVAIRCEWSEYSTWKEVALDYDIEVYLDDDEIAEQLESIYIEFDGGILVHYA